ncbi:MAG: hypothetical protein C4K60_09390 [Ideonella sp. MAG2]|nr:MAG: hypothetical protein C4K60_09390 [Ideonella sp. MAG2]
MLLSALLGVLVLVLSWGRSGGGDAADTAEQGALAQASAASLAKPLVAASAMAVAVPASGPVIAASALAQVELPIGVPLWLQQLARQPVCTPQDLSRPAAHSRASAGEAPWGAEAQALAQQRLRLTAERLTASSDAELRMMGLVLLRQHETLTQEALQQHSSTAMYGLLHLCEGWAMMTVHKPLPVPAVCASLTPERAWPMSSLDRFGLALQGLASAQDEASRDLWLERAVQHPPQITPLDRLPAAMLAHVPPKWSPEQRADALAFGFGFWATQVMAGLQGLTNACRPDKAAPGSLRQHRCLAIAEAMDRPPSTMLAARVALRLGEWHGWGLQRLQQRHLELAASVVALPAWMPNGVDGQVPDSCTGLSGLRDHTVLLASQGELGALAHGVKRSGKSWAQWAQELPPFQPRPWQAPASAP